MAGEPDQSLSIWREPPAYDDEQEKLLAGIILADIDIEMFSLDQPFSLGGNWRIQELTFRKSLVGFALERKISLKSPNWEHIAMRLAAGEHPDLQAHKRSRGRPKSMPGPFAELLGPVDGADREARELVMKLDRYNEKQREAGKPVMSNRRLAGYLATFDGHEEGTNTFEANRHKWQKRLGAARKQMR